ncbi:MAG TPA: GNAT family N-acetyltransferase [Streptosporangiaceae bacterium]
MPSDDAANAPGRAQVRRLGPDDWEISRQVRLSALADAPYAFMSTLSREQRFDEQVWRQRLGSPTAATFLAWVDGEAVGTATGKIDDPADEFTVPGSWQLVGMWVDPRARGTGVADQLIERVTCHARENGARSVTLWVTQVNARALAFYQRMGFTLTGARQPVREEEPGLWEQQMIRHVG